MSGPTRISVDIFGSSPQPRPAVLLLPGAGGVNHRHYTFADFLAKSGYLTFLVHYLDSAAVVSADRSVIRQNFSRWRQVSEDAFSYVCHHPTARNKPIGLLGISLGATLALSLAARRSGIAAVAEFFGLLPAPDAALVQGLPPTFIVHGAADQIVPIEEAHKLKHILEEHRIPHKIKIYPGEGHIFTRPTAFDAVRSTLAFFNQYLVTDSSEIPRSARTC